MKHYHGGPITPASCAMNVWKGGFAFVSFAHLNQLHLALDISQGVGIDNGAFTFWKSGKEFDWSVYYPFIEGLMNHPRFDFCIIPDVIDGGEEENDRLIKEWPHGNVGVPVWHMNESDERFIRLCNEHERVAIGSCGEYDVTKAKNCVLKLKDVIRHVVDDNGYPIAKLHMLRGLNKDIFKHLPFASADSTNIARNIGIDKNWAKGNYQPMSKEVRAYVMKNNINSVNSASSLIYNELTDKVSIQMAFEI